MERMKMTNYVVKDTDEPVFIPYEQLPDDSFFKLSSGTLGFKIEGNYRVYFYPDKCFYTDSPSGTMVRPVQVEIMVKD